MIYARELRVGDRLLEYVESGGVMLLDLPCTVDRIVRNGSDPLPVYVTYDSGEPRNRRIKLNRGEVIKVASPRPPRLSL